MKEAVEAASSWVQTSKGPDGAEPLPDLPGVLASLAASCQSLLQPPSSAPAAMVATAASDAAASKRQAAGLERMARTCEVLRRHEPAPCTEMREVGGLLHDLMLSEVVAAASRKSVPHAAAQVASSFALACDGSWLVALLFRLFPLVAADSAPSFLQEVLLQAVEKDAAAGRTLALLLARAALSLAQLEPTQPAPKFDPMRGAELLMQALASVSSDLDDPALAMLQLRPFSTCQLARFKAPMRRHLLALAAVGLRSTPTLRAALNVLLMGEAMTMQAPCKQRTCSLGHACRTQWPLTAAALLLHAPACRL